MRTRLAIVVAAALLPVGAGLALAAPPLSQSEEVHKKITGQVTSVRVDGDVSAVSVVPGRTTSVTAHLEWTRERPELSITLNRGVLVVKARCREQVMAGPQVWIGGVTECRDDLKLVIPASAALSVTTYGPVTVSRLTGTVDLRGTATTVSQVRSSQVRVRGYGSVRADHVNAAVADLHSDSGSVTAREVHGRVVTLDSSYGTVDGGNVTARTLTVRTDQGRAELEKARADVVDVSSGYGNVDVSDVRSPDVSAVSDQGSVTVDQVSGRRLVAKSSYGAVRISNVTGSRLSATSSQGDVSLDKVRGGDVVAKSGYGAVQVSSVVAVGISALTDQGTMKVSDVTARRLTATSGQGPVTVARVRGTELTAKSSYGAVVVDDAHVLRVTATSAQGTVDVRVLDAPDLVRATSGYGRVDVAVPAGRYAVDMSSGHGRTSVKNVVIDDRARRQIVATSAQGDVSITGI